jgi:STE24 endopeptidase
MQTELPDIDDPLRQRKARAYRRGERRLEAVGMVVSLAVWLVLALVAGRLASWLDTGGPLVVDAALYVIGIGAVVELASLPLAVAGWRRSRSAGLSRQDARGWLLDHIKGLVIGFVLAWPAVTALVALQRSAPDDWWLWAALAAVCLQVLLTTVGPVVLLPLFMRSRPLPDGALADDLLGLARSAGVRVSSVRLLEAGAKTSAANAFVAGLGPTRRIMLFDTLVGEDGEQSQRERLSETRSVLAHELGHHRALDLWRLLALDAVATVVALGIGAWLLDRLPEALRHGGAGSLAALPALVLCVGLVSAPLGVVGRAYSRRRERAADSFGVRLIGSGEAFAAALERMVAQNLSELRPPRPYELLRMTHPAPAARIEAARAKENRGRPRTAGA